ncbi:hypothetical protein [Bradyrhizobium jicamae]|uniref:hypothetical protein n=1 Tax=Bradyrhizobium jicamae TaxID=280332 RepID=UPI001BA756AC|nr:hypothetical protein [Bradyrhizobium jicamae]MBR0939034.1 hypothetical protein [Bradyrhizobium jicamae]
MNYDAEYLNLGDGKFCVRGAVSAALQRSYDDARRSGSDAILRHVQQQIRSAAPDDIFTKQASDVELLQKAAEVEMARTGLPRRADGVVHAAIAPGETATSIVDRVEPAGDLTAMALDVEFRHRFRSTDRAG